jgi:small subunit ribosomal protein S6
LKTGTKKLYEAMFLIKSAEAASDWEGVNKTIKAILEKADAEIVSMRKWDERKLAYNIKGQGRGTYILCYFKAEGDKIREIERDVQLSERIMRALILNAEQQTKEDIEKDTPAVLAERQGRPLTEAGKPAVDLAIPNGSHETTARREASPGGVRRPQAEETEKSEETAVRTPVLGPLGTTEGGSKESEESVQE